MGKRILHLVRHGQYQLMTSSDDEPDGPLTEAGREQAELTASRLAALPIAVIHHSTLQRAAETAAILATRFGGVPLLPSDALRECLPSIPPGYENLFATLLPGEAERGRLQVSDVFDTYFAETTGEEPRHEIIVSSGNLIRALVCRVLGAPTDAWIHADIEHCGITEVKVGPPVGLLLVRFADTGHLPERLRTY